MRIATAGVPSPAASPINRSMLRVMTLLLLIALALSPGQATPAAQEKPNLTGTWVVVSPESSAGQEETIKHEGMTLTRGHASEGEHGHSFTYKLDGSESRNVLTPHAGEEIVLLSRASWEGATLVIKETATYSNGRKREAISRWRLDEKGQLHMEVEGSMNGKPEPTIKVIYRKKG